MIRTELSSETAPAANSVPVPTPIEEFRDVDPERFHSEIVPRNRPAVLRGIADHWPLVQHSRHSPEALIDYVTGFDSGELVMTSIGPPRVKGRLVYEAGVKDLNHRHSSERLPSVLKGLLKQVQNPDPPAIAIQAVSAKVHLPGLIEENPNPLVPPDTVPRLWFGNAIITPPHFDSSDNLAVVVAGRRRFTVFPPDQIANLYLGPLDITPAGLPISMVEHDDPDFERHPRFRDALAAAYSAELRPGDAIHVPYLWWHGVHSLEKFNAMVNYWWHQDEVAAAQPYGALLYACHELFRIMPAEHRRAWQEIYKHWVFAVDSDPEAHLPVGQRTARAHLTAETVARFKQAIGELLAGVPPELSD